MRILFLSLFILLTNFSFGVHDEDPFALKVKSKLEKWVERYPQEKVYLHTDRDHYEVGDTIWFRAYLTNCYAIVNDTGIGNIYVASTAVTNGVVADSTCKTSAQFETYALLKAGADLSEYDSDIWTFTDTTISFYGDVVYTVE